MYLKSIEMKGFKSFAGKMTLDFHDGVTAIVGPNGSGKSNVADAVRWVLGEQSAKQLRGGNMQDVIFAGTQSRNPLGFATVSITLDNGGGELNIDYPLVTVTRRLYRSGESEYLINGSACRLKDIQELFYDTGIGKEGYSLIGQGQIDKILSGKPEDRRELFDEAAGIVKFKRRKAAALKKLEKEESNLVRVADILSELSKQVAPLEKQAEKARIYLNKKDELKKRDIAVFVLNEKKLNESLNELQEKYKAAKKEFEDVEKAYEAAKQQYEETDVLIKKVEEQIDELSENISGLHAKAQTTDAQRGILEEQIKNTVANRELFVSQLEESKAEKKKRLESLNSYINEKEGLEEELKLSEEALRKAEKKSEEAKKALEDKKAETEENKNALIGLLNSRSNIKEKSQKYRTLSEQISVRQSELTARMLKLSGEKDKLRENEKKLREVYEGICREIEKNEAEFNNAQEELADIKKKLTETDAALDDALSEYHRRQSLLESLENLAERYEGYGSSVKKIMEQRSTNAGILGVVAEIISTGKKYESAIETALGASLQNVVTDNEATAKYLIEYLKRGKFGRVTFLPLTAVKADKPQSLDAEGVIGVASELVDCEERFRGLVNRLLGRTFVIDTIDHAIAIGRQYGHKHRMVTLEGELISPGGAMTGGSYKNSANLLGRQRQIDELNIKVKESKGELDKREAAIVSLKQERNVLREKQSDINESLHSLYLEKNTAEVNLRSAEKRTAALEDDGKALDKEKAELERQKKEVEAFMEGMGEEIKRSSDDEREINERIETGSQEEEKLSLIERETAESLEGERLKYSQLEQKIQFVCQNIDNARAEEERLSAETDKLSKRIEQEEEDARLKADAAEKLKIEAQSLINDAKKLEGILLEKSKEREDLSKKHKEAIAKREEFSESRGLLDKEVFRLEAAIEKNDEDREKEIEYLWEEYELSPDKIEKEAVDETKNRSQLLREISALKTEIKGLGSVNVNALEEYKEVKERHEFLSAQHEDLVKARENIKTIIQGLDKEMRERFSQEFTHIQREFNDVFKRLFGGGMGSLELVENEDVLEAGVRIIAQPPGKKLQNMMQLSGGEKTLTAIALLFAIQNLKPSPFCILDEIEASLDDANVERFSRYLRRLSGSTQFIIITHRRGTMNSADRLYGITMQEKGISTMVSVDLIESGLS